MGCSDLPAAVFGAPGGPASGYGHSPAGAASLHGISVKTGATSEADAKADAGGSRMAATFKIRHTVDSAPVAAQLFTNCSIPEAMMQLSFDGLLPPEPTTPARDRRQAPADNLIFLLRPDEAARRMIVAEREALRRTLRLMGPVLDPERLHVTLQWLPAAREEVQALVPIAEAVIASVEPAAVEITLVEALSFKSASGNFPFVLRAEGPDLHALFRALGDGMRRHGWRNFAKISLTPHLTLLYDRDMVPPQPIAPIAWRAEELLFVHSRRGQGRHDVLARWPLR